MEHPRLLRPLTPALRKGRATPRPYPYPLEGWGSRQAGIGAVRTSLFRSPRGTRWTSVRNTAPALINPPPETRSASSQTQTQPLPSHRREGQHPGLEGLAGARTLVSQEMRAGACRASVSSWEELLVPMALVELAWARGAGGCDGELGQPLLRPPLHHLLCPTRPGPGASLSLEHLQGADCGCARVSVPTTRRQGPRIRPGPGGGPGRTLPADLGVCPHHRVRGCGGCGS